MGNPIDYNNPKHLDFLKEWQAITAGKQAFAVVLFDFGRPGIRKKNLYVEDCSEKVAELIYFDFTCPFCTRDAKICFPFKEEPAEFEYHNQALEQLNAEGFECNCCGSLFKMKGEASLFHLPKTSEA